jgi:hypothetical protein
MPRCGRLAAVTLALLVRPSWVSAQVQPPTEAAPLQFGPVGLYPTVVIGEMGTDSNVYNEQVDPKSDFTMTVSPRLAGVLKSGAMQFTAVTSQGYVYFHQYKDQESINISNGVRLDFMVGGLKPFMSAEHIRTRERPNTEIDTRAHRTEQNVAAGVDLNLTAVTVLTVLARVDETRYQEDEQFQGVNLSNELNRDGRFASGGLKVLLSPFTTLILAAEVQQDRFPRTHLRDSDSWRFEPTFQFSSEAAISGRAGVGYRWFSPVDPAVPGYRGVVAHVGVTYRLLDTTTFDVQATRDVMYSFEPTEPNYLTTGGGLSVTQRLVGPFSIIGRVHHERHEYQALATSSLPGRVDTVNTLGGGFAYLLSRNIRLSITGERNERRSTEPGQSYRRTRIFGSVALTA